MSLAELAIAEVEAPPDSKRYYVYWVSPRCLDMIWPQVEPLLLRTIPREHGRFATRDIYGWVRDGQQRLFVITEGGRTIAAGMARCFRHPTGKRGSTVHFAGGSRVREWFPAAIDAWTEACRLEGITEMSIVGRRGWKRFAARYGFREESMTFTREVE